MPENTIKVDRTTKWGNPCVVGKHGTREECVKFFAFALQGSFVLGMKNEDRTWLSDSLMEYRKMAIANLRHLRGKNLACWCQLPGPGQPDNCHAAILLNLANA